MKTRETGETITGPNGRTYTREEWRAVKWFDTEGNPVYQKRPKEPRMGFFKWYGRQLGKSFEVLEARKQQRVEAEAQAETDNPIVGFERRPTVTRTILFGPIGWLAFRKRRTVRRKDLK